GFVSEEYSYLVLFNPDEPLDLVSIIWGGIVLGALGAIMDVAMTIASSMNELSEHMADKSFKKMLASGMNIGRDAIGTMTNTLILAYIGSSLAVILVLTIHTKSTMFLFSMEMISVEIVQGIVGSLGILLAVPFTAIFAAWIFNKN
ncbi:MAG: YibE/F family protein, partial [Anaerovoracaceae bacterium]